jgi:hypothetical protein
LASIYLPYEHSKFRQNQSRNEGTVHVQYISACNSATGGEILENTHMCHVTIMLHTHCKPE